MQSSQSTRDYAALGYSLLAQGKPMDALIAFKEAAAREPQNVEHYNAMGQACSALLKYDKALICYQQSLSIEPKSAVALRGAYDSCRQLGDVEKAQIYLAQSPQNTATQLEQANLCPLIWGSDEHLDNWREEYKKQVNALPQADVTDAQVPVNYKLVYQGRDNLALKQAYAAKFRTDTWKGEVRKSPPYKIGVFVGEGRKQMFDTIAGRIFAGIKDNAFDIEQISSGSVEDLRGAKFDLMYFWEVGTTPANYFTPLMRVAPIQVTSWGAVETTGLPNMDYFLSSEAQESEDSEQYYSEKLVKLAHIPARLERPQIPANPIHTRADFMCADSDHLYVGAQQIFKYHPDMDAIFLGILEQDKRAKILLVGNPVEQLNQQLTARLHKALGGYSSRLVIIPPMTKESYFALLQLADVVLDSLYYCGGQTSYDAFAAGAPVVTLPGATMRSRSTAAMLDKMQLGEAMVAEDEADYIRKAVSIASNADLRAIQRNLIFERCNLLFDTQSTVQDHIEFLHQALLTKRT